MLSRSRSLSRPIRSAKSRIASRTTSLFGIESEAAACVKRAIVASSRVKVTLLDAISIPYYHTPENDLSEFSFPVIMEASNSAKQVLAF